MPTTECSVLTAPIWIEVANIALNEENVNISTISWGAPCGGVDSYTFYYTSGVGLCNNVTLDSTITSYTIENGQQIQIATHRNDITKCSQGMYCCNDPSVLYVISKATSTCTRLFNLQPSSEG